MLQPDSNGLLKTNTFEVVNNFFFDETFKKVETSCQ